MSDLTLDRIDLARNEIYRHGFPHEIFTLLRREAPVWKHPRTEGVAACGADAFWVVSTLADVVEISRDADRFRSFEGPRLAGWPPHARGQMLITMDPPAHTRMRKLIAAGFTPRMVAALDEQARVWARKIVDRALELGSFNFVHEVAYQLPMHMIADVVGIPEADRQHVFSLVDTVLYGLDFENRMDPTEHQKAQGELFMYGRQLGEHKRANPVDDVWSTLATAKIAQDDGSETSLSEIELDLFFTVFTVAGSETTRNSIANGLLALVQHPEQLHRMRTDPSIINNAVEEIVRWSSPVTYFRRTAVDDVEFRGHRIAAGEAVTLWYPSANRDEQVFEDPFRFDVARPGNLQVGFGGPGVHHCLGANLARREIRVMFEELFARVAEIEITGDPVYSVTGVESPVSFSLKELPVRITAK